MAKNPGRNTGQGAWEGSMEALEQRALLTGTVDVVLPHEMITWWGGPLEVVTDSWVVTFDQRYGEAGAINRANQVAAALGVTPEAGSVRSVGRGRWAAFKTTGQVSEAQARQLPQVLPFVRVLEPESIERPRLVPNDARFAEQWAHLNTGQAIMGIPGVSGADIGSTQGWDLQTGSSNVIVAVLDSGIDLFHPDLRDNIWVNPREIPNNNADDDGNGFIDDVNGWDFGNNDNNPQVQPGAEAHGVAVSGVIGAVGNNGIGVAGVAWHVSILPVKVGADMGGITGVIAAVDYITMMRTDFNVNIVAANASFGSLSAMDPNFFDDAEELAIRAFTDSGGLFVASAGNDMNNNDGPLFSFPDGYPNDFIIAVAATDNQDGLADFSNYGATTVDLGAPGVNILTLALGGGYQYIDGTSFSAPYTAGAVALLASASPFATQSQLRLALLNGVDPLPALAGKCVTGGRLNVNNSLRLVGFPGPIVTDISPGVQSGPVDEITIGFSKALNPGAFAVAGVELRAANGDGDFNANDIFYSFLLSDIEIQGSVMRIHIRSGNLPIDAYQLTLFYQYFRDTEGNYLNGTTAGGHDENYAFQIIAGGGPLEPNDAIGQATPVIVGSGGTALYTNINIGDGANPLLDVDIYRLTMAGPGLITVQVDAKSLPSPSDLDSYLRLFDGSGRELARNDNFNGLDSRVQYFVPAGGRYYIGVSGFGNSVYLPGQQASGTPGESQGSYNISFVVTQTAPESGTFGSIGPPIPIPTTGTIVGTIFVPDIRKVKDVNVRVNIAHTYVGDLELRLISPGGTVIPLVLNRGGSSPLGFVNTVFDDEAAASITTGTAKFTGSWQPEGSLPALDTPLSRIDGQSAYGFWTLQVVDNRALNGGSLQNWSIDLLLENSIAGPFEFNDTILTATDTGIVATTIKTFDAAIGDGAYGKLDVDLFRFIAPAGTTVTAVVSLPAVGPNGAPNLLHSVLRLFDQQGNALLLDTRIDANTSSIAFPVQFAGTFYLGVSGGVNISYNPDHGGSGTASAASGSYSLQIAIVGGITTGSVVLQGNNLTVGVSGDGAIGPAANQAVGVRLGTTEFLVPANTPTSTESFYGATFNGFLFRNGGIISDLPSTVTHESDFSNRRAAIQGLFRANTPQSDQGGGLLVDRSISFGVQDSFLVIDVTLRNTTFDTLSGVSWVEGFRPQQAKNLGSLFTRTVNNVQNATQRLATATYTNTDFPGGATIGIGGAAPAAGAVFFSVEQPGTVRDPSQVILSPVDPDPSGADTGVEGDGTLTVAYNLGSLDPGATFKVRYFIFTGSSLGAVQGQFATLISGAGSGHLVASPTDPSIPATSLPYSLYYPEGYANSRISEFLPLVNPHDEAARVVVTARYEDTSIAPAVLFDGTVAANARGGITITTPSLYGANTLLVRKDTPYALEIKSTLPIGATLSHYDFGISTGQAFTSHPSALWTFSEGFKTGGVNDFVVFYNTTTRTVKVTMTVYQETSAQKFVTTQTVLSQRRGGWAMAQLPFVPSGPFAVKLDAEGEIVAALTHYDTNLHGGFTVLGQPDLGSVQAVSPEGQVGQHATNEFVTILNQGTTPTLVTFTFFFENQSAYRRQVLVPAERRSGFNVSLLPGFPQSTQPYSIGYEADQPVTVTLSSFAFGSATGTRFSDSARTVWLFADGFKPGSGSAVTEYLRLFNPTTRDLTVEITLDFAAIGASGSQPAVPAGSVTFRRVLTGRAANDFDVHEFITGARATRDTYYSVTIHAPTPVVAYDGHFDAFFGGGFGTLGTFLGSESLAII